MDTNHLDDDQTGSASRPRTLIGNQRLRGQTALGQIGVVTCREDTVTDLGRLDAERREQMIEAHNLVFTSLLAFIEDLPEQPFLFFYIFRSS